jgi:hypothetical protein
MPSPSSPLIKQTLVARTRERLAKGESLSRIAVDYGEPEVKEAKKRGRWRKFSLTLQERRALRALSLKHESFEFGIERFVDDPWCSVETREIIRAELDLAAQQQRRPRWPQTLRDEILSSQEERDLFRGPRTFASTEHSPRKGMFFEDADGNEVPICAHTIWSMDDYSTNQPYIIETEDGPRLCRQTLMSMDLYSAAWLSVEMIGRERDAYRAEDILRFILRTIEGQGTMPLALMLERGRWDSIAVHGVKLDELGKGFARKYWGGLDDLFIVEHGYSSRWKAFLESSFGFLQTILAHSGRDIGRFRGEFERAAKLYLAINHKETKRESRPCPRKAGFLEQDASRAAHWMAAQTMNQRSRERSASEFEGKAHVPNDLLMNERDPVRPLPDSERWRFNPVKRLASVRGGFIETQVTQYQGASFRFEVNGISDLYVNNGHRVLIAFDPALPHQGCYVANAEPRDREGRIVGDFMITAQHARDVAQFSLYTRKGENESTKKRANAAARTSFAAINPHKLGMTHTQSHDGNGNAQIATTGNPAPSARISQPASRTARGVTVSGLTSSSPRLTASSAPSLDAETIASSRRAKLAAAEAALD